MSKFFALRTLTGMLLLSLLSVTAWSQEFSTAAPRPDPEGTPTEVTVGAHVFDIEKIDDGAQRFSIDAFLLVRWLDPRLAAEDGQELGRIRTIDANQIWSPRFLLINNRGVTMTMPDMVSIDDKGYVTFRQRFFGEMSANLVFNNFPFDQQLLTIDLISYSYSPDEVIFKSVGYFSGSTSVFSAEGWTFEMMPVVATEYGIPELNVKRPMLRMPIRAMRDTNYYLLTMMIPMSLIVFMSWMAFWLPPTIVPARMGVSTAAIFSLIAFGFSVRLTLPPVSYLTKADVFVLGTTSMVFVALFCTVIGSRWAERGKLDQAVELNSKARWLYVILFLLVCILSWII